MLFYNIIKFLENPYREDLVVKITFISSVLLNAITWFIIFYKLYPFSYLTEYGQIFLHYNVYFGVDNIGFWYKAFIIPALGLFIIFLNNILAYIFYLQEKIISYVLIIGQALLQIILLAAAIFVILLNI